MTVSFDVARQREQFPALSRRVAGRQAVFFDGPAGSQVPSRVADAIHCALLSTNANHGGHFATARESDAILDDAHRTVADFLGTSDPDCVIFGANMTSLTFSLSRALAKTWGKGDEILVTNLDHDANVTPWILAAKDAGADVRRVGVRLEDGTLDLGAFESQLSERTRLFAVGYASNATGSINPIGRMIEQAHAVGALVFVDAVHYAPHGLIDVEALDVDFLACSAYKFFGPHLGILYGRRSHLEQLTAYKLRPAPDTLPQKWMTGTQSHEAIAGTAEAVRYLADVHKNGRNENPGLRDGLSSSFDAIVAYERELVEHLLEGLEKFPTIRVWGIREKSRLSERVPTVSFTHSRLSPGTLATRLGDAGIFVWHGNHYALPFTEAAGLEPQGTLRVGLLHYNTHDEVDRLLTRLKNV